MCRRTVDGEGGLRERQPCEALCHRSFTVVSHRGMLSERPLESHQGLKVPSHPRKRPLWFPGRRLMALLAALLLVSLESKAANPSPPSTAAEVYRGGNFIAEGESIRV